MEFEVQREKGPEAVAATEDACTLELIELGSESRKISFKRGESVGEILRRNGVESRGRIVSQNTVTVQNPDNTEALPDAFVTVVGEVHNG